LVSDPVGERTVAALPAVAFADGSRAAVELVLAETAAPDADVFAALVFLQDRSGRFAVVYSPRRQEWASPGGGREADESARHTVVREVLEETGLELGARDLVPCGYERFTPLTAGRWPDRGGVLQVFHTRLGQDAPPLGGDADDVTDRRWVTLTEFEELCGSAFWWPMAAALFSD
jgi:8-oxo-dGTP pyrophosphatase MutT (NUDIX family)